MLLEHNVCPSFQFPTPAINWFCADDVVVRTYIDELRATSAELGNRLTIINHMLEGMIVCP